MLVIGACGSGGIGHSLGHAWVRCRGCTAGRRVDGFPALAQSRVGIVLMHGKQSTPERMQRLADALSGAGYLVERPEMCWSERRIYDRAYPDCLSDVDAAVARLRVAGVSGVVVAGQSLGGNAALAYGARRDGLLGVITPAAA